MQARTIYSGAYDELRELAEKWGAADISAREPEYRANLKDEYLR